MKKILYLFIVSLLLFSCKEEASQEVENTPETKKEETTSRTGRIALVIHGGAGTILKKNMTPEKEAAYKAKLEEALKAGYTVLEHGGSSLDAVEKTIHVMENSPLFNAGKGAVFTNAETNELDASIMTGHDLNAGAVAGITTIKNPISAARKVMEESVHVMLSGKGAEAFAEDRDLELVEPSYFHTDNRFKALKRIQEKEKTELDHDEKVSFFDPEINDSKYGTVGCVALDKNGNITAGTSTGGMTNKRWGRIGDSPVIGSGTYANNKTCGVSSTGHGEYFIRAQVAHDISAMMEYKNASLQEASTEVIHDKLTEMGGTGGIVALDASGNIAMEFNTAGMYRGYIDTKGELYIGIYKEE
ncbi:MAG: isoaspartyl peptidase/L-asparaginase [Flavobacteriaceae bacterium]|nr:isoaspartyl peptidase/L-asparaginase [Flavobacteriaceae bacterium]